MYKAVKITAGSGGWGGPLVIQPTEKKCKIVSITGGGVDELAQYIAQLTGCEAVDGFNHGVAEEEIACVVIDCGGTARCGVYPKKRIPTVNLTAVGATGPLARYITEDIYVSDVKQQNVQLTEAGAVPASAEPVRAAQGSGTETSNAKAENGRKEGVVVRMGKAVGTVVNKLFQAGRDTIDMVIKNVLPFMAFVAMIIGIVQGTGLGDIIAATIAPAVGSLPGMLIISLVCAIPIISPIIGPGAVIAQVVGVLAGNELAKGSIAPSMALPALFAIDAQVGGDFVPVGLSLGEAEPETIDAGVPAVLFSRLLTGPLAVIIAYVCSFGLY